MRHGRRDLHSARRSLILQAGLTNPALFSAGGHSPMPRCKPLAMQLRRKFVAAGGFLRGGERADVGAPISTSVDSVTSRLM